MSRNELPPPDKFCSACRTRSVAESLRCGMCGKYSHLTCSGLRNYHIVHYFHSRIQHTCAKCVRQKKCSSVDIDYDAEFPNVKKLVQLEIERKKRVVDSNDRIILLTHLIVPMMSPKQLSTTLPMRVRTR